MPKFTVSAIFDVETDDKWVTPDKAAEIVNDVLSDAATKKTPLALTANGKDFLVASVLTVVAASAKN
jgi:hypothetical protein